MASTTNDQKRPQKKRTRLSPEARRAQILDVAREILTEDGVAGFTMERVAERAEVSSQLVYNYFPSRLDLLQKLYGREYRAAGETLTALLAEAETFEQVARVVVEMTFEGRSSGGVLSMLGADPEITAPHQEKFRRNGRKLGKILIDSLASEHEVAPSMAIRLLGMASGAAEAAADNWTSSRISCRDAVDETMLFISGGIRHVLAETSVPSNQSAS